MTLEVFLVIHDTEVDLAASERRVKYNLYDE